MQATVAHEDKSSILADKVSFKMLKRWIPGLTLYRFNVARHHQLLHGRGAVLPTEHHTRMYVAPGQLSHFLNFITSGHIIQDLPFGEKKLKLSSNEELVIPNVIRTVIATQVVSQYEELCSEEGSNRWDAELCTRYCMFAQPL